MFLIIMYMLIMLTLPLLLSLRFVAELPPWKPFNASLDDSQIRAISLALSAKDIALVHGPPGKEGDQKAKPDSRT